jgi:hypothetical protein
MNRISGYIEQLERERAPGYEPAPSRTHRIPKLIEVWKEERTLRDYCRPVLERCFKPLVYTSLAAATLFGLAGIAFSLRDLDELDSSAPYSTQLKTPDKLKNASYPSNSPQLEELRAGN